MRRQEVEDAIEAARVFVRSANEALEDATKHKQDWEDHWAEREDRASRKVPSLPGDNVAIGTIASGQCRRDSLDLTRKLAKMRKPS